ncbi:MAG: FAD-dependent oxidoreductase [Candidatus Paceibacterota bacterium]|jgi:ferredoxin-NADP reductase
MTNNTTYIIKEVVEEAPDVKTLKLTLLNGTVPPYTAGQFITVYFPETKTLEGKSYTFSSAPHENTCNITIKNIGEFSGRLCSLKVGETIEASMPYGFFSSEYPEAELILIAGGIGITPFRSMVKGHLWQNPKRNIHLFHSTKTMSDIVFKKEFEELSENYPNLKIAYNLTQELNIPENMKKGRIDVPTLLNSLEKTTDKEFLICGSISFVRDIWKALRDQGISEDVIYTEAFFR